MSYVLVHGSWHGAWCWFKLAPRLRAAGHEVVAVELPGHGRDWRDPASVSLEDYVSAVIAALDSSTEPAVLVGHSRGGIVISQVAERAPERIRELVYLAAFLVPTGQTMLDWALADTGSAILGNLTIDEQRGCNTLAPSAVREALYDDCSDDDVELAGALLTPEPNAPLATPLQLTEQRYGTVPKTYCETLHDRGVTLELQRRMQQLTPCDRVLQLESAHSPFLSQPDQLAAALLSLR